MLWFIFAMFSVKILVLIITVRARFSSVDQISVQLNQV